MVSLTDCITLSIYRDQILLGLTTGQTPFMGSPNIYFTNHLFKLHYFLRTFGVEL